MDSDGAAGGLDDLLLRASRRAERRHAVYDRRPGNLEGADGHSALGFLLGLFFPADARRLDGGSLRRQARLCLRLCVLVAGFDSDRVRQKPADVDRVARLVGNRTGRGVSRRRARRGQLVSGPRTRDGYRQLSGRSPSGHCVDQLGRRMVPGSLRLEAVFHRHGRRSVALALSVDGFFAQVGRRGSAVVRYRREEAGVVR